jgi:hypothetical protein
MGTNSTKGLRRTEAVLDRINNSNPPSLGAPLLLYVAASHAAVSAALVQEKQDDQAKKQVPVYFVSEVLSPSKKNYTELDNVLYVVLTASRKLRHYFQTYHIIVPSSQPLKDIMRNREATWRVGKWVAELNEFTIDYVHRSSIQSQALADFIADWTLGAHDEERTNDAEAWIVFCDGSWGTFGAGAAVVLIHHLKSKHVMQQGWISTAQITLQSMKPFSWGFKAMEIRREILKSDSQVISGHVDKSSKARGTKLEKYLDTVRRMEASFEGFSVKNILRGENEHADLVAKSAAQGLPLPSEVFFWNNKSTFGRAHGESSA